MEKYAFALGICALLIFSNYTVVVGVDAARKELGDARKTIEYLKPVSTNVSSDIFIISENIGRAVGYLEAAKSRDDIPLALAVIMTFGFGFQEWRHLKLKKANEQHTQKKP